MRDWTGGPWQLIEDQRSRDFASAVDYFLRDLSRGVQRIQQGQVPDGSGNPIPIPPEQGSLLDYLFLPGRLGGQRVHSVDATSSTVRIDSSSLPAGVVGTFGTFSKPALAIYAAEEVVAGLGSIRFGTNAELAFVSPDSTGFGVGVWFPSSDGTSALRISSTTNRTFLQCGLVDSSGNIQNASMTLGASGARVATSLATEFLRLTLSPSASPLADGSSTAVPNSMRVGINIRPDEYAGSADGVKGKSLHLGDLQVSAGPATWPADTDPAPLILENSGGSASRVMMDVRTPSTGVTTTKQLGLLSFTLNGIGDMKWFRTGSRLMRIRALGDAGSVTGNGGLQLLNLNDRLQFETLPEVGGWTDSALSLYLRAANTTTEVNRMIMCSQGSATFSRLGICATSTVLGPSPVASLPVPASSRILTTVNSSGTALSGFDSAGAYFLLAGAAAGKLLQSDSGGVGSWGLTLSGNYTLSGAITINGTLGPSALAPTFQWPNDSVTAFLVVDDTAGNTMSLGVTGVVAGGAIAYIPAAGGTLVTTIATQTLSNKTVSQGVASQSTDLTPVSVGATNVIATPTSGAFTWTLIVFVTVADVTAGTYQVDLGWTDSNGARTSSSGAVSLAATSQNTFTGVGQRQSGAITFTRTLTAGAGTSKIRYFIRIT